MGEPARLSMPSSIGTVSVSVPESGRVRARGNEKVMNIKQLFTDDDAVSPVIGVILMVAITVILAAVIGTFVLGLGDQVQSTSPQASFNFDFTDDTGTGPTVDRLDITHDGGDSIEPARLAVVSSDAIGAGAANGSTADYVTNIPFDDGTYTISGDVSAGTTIAVSSDVSSEEMNDNTIRVVWTSESGENSATLGEWTGPNA